MVFVKKIAHTLEISLATHSRSADQAMRDERQAGIAQIPNPIERSVVKQLDAFALRHPKAAATTLSGLSRAISGVSYIGNGAFSSVYRKNDEVLKVYRRTALMDEQTREQLRDERAAMCDNLYTYLGPMVAKQTLSVGDHPLGAYRVVMAHQPFVAGDGLDLFTPDTLELQADSISRYCERQPNGQAQLTRLAEATFESEDGAGIVPDMNGVDNFRLAGSDQSLILIDAEPISAQVDRRVHDLILRQAERLAGFLEAA